MEAPAFEPPERRPTGHQLLDIVTSVCALVISFVSIFMAYDNGRDMQRLVHANSWPVLQLGSGNAGDKPGHRVLGFKVRNAGIGPARIHRFDLLVDGKPVRDEYLIRGLVQASSPEAWKAARAKTTEDREALGSNWSRPISRTFLAPGEEAVAFGWPATEINEPLWRLVDEARQAGRITTRVCYCSVFDECWVADGKAFPPAPVDRCR
jgi:hypothetical protein